MATLRQIRSQLRSIGNTKQIMRAMQLVSASKLKRAQDQLRQARSMLDFLDGLLQRLLAQSGPSTRSADGGARSGFRPTGWRDLNGEHYMMTLRNS